LVEHADEVIGAAEPAQPSHLGDVQPRVLQQQPGALQPAVLEVGGERLPAELAEEPRQVVGVHAQVPRHILAAERTLKVVRNKVARRLPGEARLAGRLLRRREGKHPPRRDQEALEGVPEKTVGRLRRRDASQQSGQRVLIPGQSPGHHASLHRIAGACRPAAHQVEARHRRIKNHTHRHVGLARLRPHPAPGRDKQTVARLQHHLRGGSGALQLEARRAI
jgi:hypothetical protein